MTSQTIEFTPQAMEWASLSLCRQGHSKTDGSRTGGSSSSRAGDGGCVAIDNSDSSVSPEIERRLCELIGRMQPHLSPVALSTPLLGMDSLRISLLANALRRELAKEVASNAIREASTVRHLLDIVLEARDVPQCSEAHQHLEQPSLSGTWWPKCMRSGSASSREFAVWFTPGQFAPMGAWVLRSDAPVDHRAMRNAIAGLIDRHSALRATLVDPQALRSFVLNAAVLASLFGPLFLGPRGRKSLASAMCAAWPRIRIAPRSSVYSGLADRGGHTPFEVIVISEGGQPALERAIVDRRWEFQSRPPFDAVLFELQVQAVGVWELQGAGRITILRHDGRLVYVDPQKRHAGTLVAPQDASWLATPVAFPALFSARLSDGGAVWLRWEHAEKIVVHYRSDPRSSASSSQFAIYRRPQVRDQRERISFLVLRCFHAFADGYSYQPLVGDLFDLYAAGVDERGREARLPPLLEVFDVLERRLFDTLNFHTDAPERQSLRGGFWNFRGSGYSHSLRFDDSAVTVLRWVSERYHLPMDGLMLSLVTVAMARAGARELVELTLYANMREGQDASLIGLFSDWRDVAVATPRGHATVLGVALQVADILRHRRWTVFNPVRKAERTVVNFDTLDPRRHGPFAQLPGSHWDGVKGRLGQRPMRGDQPDWVNQPLQFGFCEEGPMLWWIHMRMAYSSYPPDWARRFAKGVEEAVWDLAFRPDGPVHRPYPAGFH